MPVRRHAFTLVELLVVIAILGIMIALVLPAIQSVLESARSSNCRFNLSQLYLAVKNHRNSKGHYPASFTKDAWSAQTQILPYLEQKSLQDQFDFQAGYGDSEFKKTRVASYMCPSEIHDTPRLKDGEEIHHPLNYVFNLGDWFVYDPATGDGGQGAFYPFSRLTERNFTDGLTSTICASEAKAYTPYYRNAGKDPSELQLPGEPSEVEALASGAEAKMGASLMKNTGHTEWVDGRAHQTGFTATFTPNSEVIVERDGRRYDVDWTNQQEAKSDDKMTYAAVTARSYHVRSVNAVMMGGSVHSFSDDIDLEVWRALSTRNGGEVTAGKY